MNSQVEKAVKMLQAKERLLEVARREVKELQWVTFVSTLW